MKRKLLRRIVRAAVLVGALMSVSAAYVLYPPPIRQVEFPGGKRFAFSIVDDTDQATLDRVRPVYDVIYKAGLRTTKTVWVLGTGDEPVPTNQGASLSDADYREWILDLQRKGFEIGLHGVRGGSSTRDLIKAGLDEFKRVLGTHPRLHVNHALNRDNLYWGSHRWTFAPYRWLFEFSRPFGFAGHVRESPYFWGDLAQERIKYVRRNTFTEINLLRASPWTPYRVSGLPYVNYWFDASDGGSIDQFEMLLRNENLDLLEREGGVAIVYAHLGAGSFNLGHEADPRFVARIRAVASRNGWFAPVSDILDHLARQPGWTPVLGARDNLRLDTSFLLDRVF